MSRRTVTSVARDQGGVIRPHERDTDDVTPTVTGKLLPEHAAAIFNTEDKAMSNPGRREYRNHLRRMIVWIQEKYESIAEQIVRVVIVRLSKKEHHQNASTGLMMSWTFTMAALILYLLRHFLLSSHKINQMGKCTSLLPTLVNSTMQSSGAAKYPTPTSLPISTHRWTSLWHPTKKITLQKRKKAMLMSKRQMLSPAHYLLFDLLMQYGPSAREMYLCGALLC